MQQLFGREPEIALLNAVFTSGRAEFVALYGRRRVGKTYLIRQFFEGRETLYFEFTGQKDATLTVQLHDFKETLQTEFYATTHQRWGETLDPDSLAFRRYPDILKPIRIALIPREYRTSP